MGVVFIPPMRMVTLHHLHGITIYGTQLKKETGVAIVRAKVDQKFLLDLGKQAIPVVEVAAMRPVTVVISEGVEIEVKELPNTCMGGGATCVH